MSQSHFEPIPKLTGGKLPGDRLEPGKPWSQSAVPKADHRPTSFTCKDGTRCWANAACINIYPASPLSDSLSSIMALLNEDLSIGQSYLDAKYL